MSIVRRGPSATQRERSLSSSAENSDGLRRQLARACAPAARKAHNAAAVHRAKTMAEGARYDAAAQRDDDAGEQHRRDEDGQAAAMRQSRTSTSERCAAMRSRISQRAEASPGAASRERGPQGLRMDDDRRATRARRLPTPRGSPERHAVAVGLRLADQHDAVAEESLEHGASSCSRARVFRDTYVERRAEARSRSAHRCTAASAPGTAAPRASGKPPSSVGIASEKRRVTRSASRASSPMPSRAFPEQREERRVDARAPRACARRW